MKLIIGLGNPEQKYDNTRHNIGFDFLDSISNNNFINNSKFNVLCMETSINGEKIFFLKPLSYMNLSGEVVKKIVSYYKINTSDILVVHDDIDLPLGKVKLSFNHGHGGHNGVRNIIDNLSTKEFLRLRIGVGSPQYEVIDYVLGKFSSKEENVINNTFSKLSNIAYDFVSLDTNMLINKYNNLD